MNNLDKAQKVIDGLKYAISIQLFCHPDSIVDDDLINGVKILQKLIDKEKDKTKNNCSIISGNTPKPERSKWW